MAPERLLGVRDDPRSDMFSLGVLLYFFTTGERPFGESETLRAMRRRLWRDPYPPRELRRGLSALAAGDRAALSRDRAGRGAIRRRRSSPSISLIRTRSSSPRARKRLKRDPLSIVWRRRFNRGVMPPRAKSDVAAQIASSPILAVALDTAEGAERAERGAARARPSAFSRRLPSARLACLNVLKLNRIAIDRTLDEQGSNKHIDRLVALRHWATPLKLDESRLSVHVLEAVDPADGAAGIRRGQSRRPHHHRRAAEFVPPHAARQRLGQGGRGSGLHRHRGAAAADGCGETRRRRRVGLGKDQAAWAAWTERLRRIGQQNCGPGSP